MNDADKGLAAAMVAMEAAALLGTVFGMVAENTHQTMNGMSIAYGLDEFAEQVKAHRERALAHLSDEAHYSLPTIAKG